MSSIAGGGSTVGFPARSDFVGETVSRFADVNGIDQAVAQRVTRFILDRLFVRDAEWEAALTGPSGPENFRRAQEALDEGLVALLDGDVMRLVTAGRMRRSFREARRQVPPLRRRCQQRNFPCA